MTAASSFTVPPPAPKAAPRRNVGCIIALVIVGLALFGLVAIAVTAYRALRLGPEARDLRNAAREHFEDSGSWHPQVELRLGPVLCGLGREILIRAVDDPNATAVLRTARAIDCGVYQVSAPSTSAGSAGFLRAASAKMTARGWARAVVVVEGTTTVAIFVPEKMGGAKAFECGVMVYDGETLVVAVVEADLAPLVKLVQREIARSTAEQLED